MKTIAVLLLALTLGGCAVTQKLGVEYKPEVAENKLQKEFDTLPAPASGRPIIVAVYSFMDKTGQRKPVPGIASLSSAVTQGGEVFLIKALQDVGRGQWFEVVERVSIDALTRERQLIRQMREAYDGANAKPLMPMVFAGILIEGGIIGYDSGSESGGAAYRFLGVGPQTSYSKDTVTISLRAVSVQTGKVLAAITVTKIVYSTADSVAVLKFLNQGTQAFEAETGLTINEPGTLAVKATVESGVVELIKEGQRKGVWEFKYPLVEAKKYLIGGGGFEPEPKKVVEEEKKEEVKVEEKKDVVVQPKAITETKTETVPSAAKAEVKKEEVKPAPRPLFGSRKLTEDSYLYKEADEKSQRTWQLKKGTELTIVSPGPEGWHMVMDAEKHKGYVRQQVLTPDTPRTSE